MISGFLWRGGATIREGALIMRNTVTLPLFTILTRHNFPPKQDYQ